MSNKHVISSEHVIYHFRPDMEPKWYIDSGDTIELHAPDGAHGQIQTEDDVMEELDEDKINDCIGPVFVRGAMPGDTLVFDIMEIKVPSPQGYVLVFPTFGLLREEVNNGRTKITKIDDFFVYFNEIRLPIKPVIGTIGVAPPEDSWSTLYGHDYGGNMDCTEICPGSRLYLPVAVEGGLLAMGDGKAVMGDGEVCGTGVGVPLIITGRVDVIKKSIKRPIIETENEWMTVANEETLEEASKVANSDLINILQKAHGISWEEAYMLTSLVGNLHICQVVNPTKTVRMAISKKYLTTAIL